MTAAPKAPFSRPFSAILGLTLLGLGLFFMVFLFQMAQPDLVTRFWDETPCEITDCRIEKNNGSVWLNVSYAYKKWNDKYVSHLYDLNNGNELNVGEVYALWDKYRSQASTVCYVNPQNPAEAVLAHGSFTKTYLMFLPLLLVVFGTLGIVRAIYPRIFVAPSQSAARKAKKSVQKIVQHATSTVLKPKSSLPPTTVPKPFPSGKLVLTPENKKNRRLWLTLFGAISLNGLLFSTASNVVSGWEKGDPSWFLTLGLIPFVAVGLFLVGLFLYFLFLRMNPSPLIILENGRISLGDTINGNWKFKGSPSRIRRLKIQLEGREQVTYERNGEPVTDQRIFNKIPLEDTSDLRFYSDGHISVNISKSNMHSFETGPYSVSWYLTIFGSIPFWPDINEEFKIIVLPYPAQ